MRYARIPLCITDPNLADNPIVFANPAFLDLTGYDEDEVIGKNCRILQCEGTTKESIAAVRQVIAEQRVDTVEILNRRKDGSRFVNALQIGPILDDAGKLIFYFGSQLDVTAKRDAERQIRKLADDEMIHRLRNITNVMAVIIKMSARDEDDVRVFGSKVADRLRTLSAAHFQTANLSTDQKLSFRDLSQEILRAYSPNGHQHFILSGPDVLLPAGLISCVALSLHELATNSVKHGALNSDAGLIDLQWSSDICGDDQAFAFKWQESGGPKVLKPQRQSGSRIISDLVTAVGGTITMDWHEKGLIVDVNLSF